MVYMPMVGFAARSWAVGSPAYVVRSSRADVMAPDIRALMREFVPESPMYRIFTMEALAERSMAQLSFTMLMLALASGLALILGAVGAVLSHATSFQIHLTQVISIGAGESAQAIHRDQWAFDFFPFPVGTEVQCNTIWAMTDFTEENGATRVIPGSHHPR